MHLLSVYMYYCMTHNKPLKEVDSCTMAKLYSLYYGIRKYRRCKSLNHYCQSVFGASPYNNYCNNDFFIEN